MVETVDSIKLATTLHKECEKAERQAPLDVLVQVLVNDTEGSKHGVSPQDSFGVVSHIRDNCGSLNFRGIMSMGAVGDVEEFRQINKLKEEME